ncbi:HD domain-containing protein [Desulfosporosinus sp. PR]|uniref:HD domain-containing protein n=1 Tax=Candidatus Desulfosporosinus nitrosoreducens TaxID=3401928 RepID=UPI0027F1ABCA|nr:HD domain-containing protein [Desulfosporosinus sp. PR]MDQ7092341.1 HD domain-containing protein [Desulfosporosinus sp. PR]
MNLSQIDYLDTWLEDYSRSFLSGDTQVDTNIQFKIDHTYRVWDNSLDLAAFLNLNANNTRIAEAIGLLHDVGRFEQFTRYGTYRDDISEDHAELGLQVLADNRILDGLVDVEKNIIESAIKYHNKYALPQEISGDCLMFCKLIRDADKLDIFEQLANETAEGVPDKAECSREVAEVILAGKVVPFTMLRTSSDFKLMRMSWVLDVNYDLTLEKIVKLRFMEQTISKLELKGDIRKVYSYLKNYIEERLREY